MGLSGLEPNGNADSSDGFFEKALLNATESIHVNAQAGSETRPKQEVKVVANGHSHSMLRFRLIYVTLFYAHDPRFSHGKLSTREGSLDVLWWWRVRETFSLFIL